MGHQQIMLLLVAMLAVGVAIAVGIASFDSANASSNRDAIINDLQNLSSSAYQYKIRLAALGGGGGSYVGYHVPRAFNPNDNAAYSTSRSTAKSITLVGTSAQGYGTVTVDCDSSGRLGNFSYGGDFQSGLVSN